VIQIRYMTVNLTSHCTRQLLILLFADIQHLLKAKYLKFGTYYKTRV